MYTVYAGRQLLQLLSQERGQEIEARNFFNEEFWPVFFDAEDKQHLMQVTNSPFFQGAYKKSAKKEEIPLPLYRKQKFWENVKEATAEGALPDGSIGVGYMAGSADAATFSQVTDLDFSVSEDQLLCSWFGGALGIGFGGGYNFLPNHPKLLHFIAEGWRYYRRTLQETPGLKGRQIETWNGLWFRYGLRKRHDPEAAFRRLSQNLDQHLKRSGAELSLERPEWSDQVFELAREFGDQPLQLQGYSYGQMNKTLGYLMVQLPTIRRLPDLFDALLEKDSDLENKPLEDVFRAEYNLSRAARTGQLGVRALTPKDLPKYLLFEDENKNPKSHFKKNPYQFFIYKTWIIAMLNNEDLHNLSGELAAALEAYIARGRTKASTAGDKDKNVENLWAEYRPARFIDGLTTIVDELRTDGEEPDAVYARAKTAVATQITPEQFHLFRSLVRFDLTYNRAKA